VKKLATAELSADELQAKVKSLKEELFQLRFKFATGQLEKPAQMKTVRKDIARCLNALAALAKKAGAASGPAGA
jgi:large subunit ribosomal protein L29